MSVLNPIELFAETIHMLTNANCPQCGKKDGLALAPGRKDAGGCEWCHGRHQLLDQCRHWLQRGGTKTVKDGPSPRSVARQAGGY